MAIGGHFWFTLDEFFGSGIELVNRLGATKKKNAHSPSQHVSMVALICRQFTLVLFFCGHVT